MDNEADMVISIMSYKNEWFTLLKFNQIYIYIYIYICQNQKLQIPIFMVYKAWDVQSTNFKYSSSVTDICNENQRQPLYNFVS